MCANRHIYTCILTLRVLRIPWIAAGYSADGPFLTRLLIVAMHPVRSLFIGFGCPYDMPEFLH